MECGGQTRDAADGRQHFRLCRVRDGQVFELEIDLAGDYQRQNIITATAAIDFLHEETPLTISRRAFIDGVRHAAADTSLLGRWQKLADAPLTVCDTGHNAHGLARVADQLKKTPYNKLYCVIGFVRDKDLAHILPLLPQGEAAASVAEAIWRARELARPDDMIFIGGSTYVVAEAPLSE